MGETFRHRCADGGYEAAVSGGRDFGFYAVTSTVVCVECRTLSDISIGTWEGTSPDLVDPVPPRCPKEPDHLARYWASGDPCPRCGLSLVGGELALNWD